MAAATLAAVAILLPVAPARGQQATLAADIGESIVQIPVVVGGKPTGDHMVGTVYKPPGDGPFPFALINHGRAGTAVERAQVRRWRYTGAARHLVRKGFAVIVPTRRGYGDTGGRDVENSYNCSNPWFREAVDGAVESALSAVEYMKRQPHVDPARYVVIGQSVGGLTAVGMAAANPPGLVAAVNFAGGHGGRPAESPGVSCAHEKLRDVYAALGRTARVPMLWIYTENDRYFGPDLSRAWHKAFVEAGGRAEFRLLPDFRTDGHTLFVQGQELWVPLLDAFLGSAGF